ncbi:wHTH domain-containing protein [Streptomyces prasinus]
MMHAPVDVYDPVLISRHLDGRSPRLDPAEPVPLHHLLRGAAVTALAPEEIATRLAGLGYRVPEAGRLSTIEAEDITLVSRNLDGTAPWAESGSAPRLRSHILRAAVELKRSPAELATRYTALGYRAPDPGSLPQWIPENHDVGMVTVDGRYEGDPRDDGEPVSLGHVLAFLQSVHVISLDPQQTRAKAVSAGERLADMGYRTEFDPADVTVDDIVLSSRKLDGCAPWLDQDEQVPLAHVLRCAHLLGRNPNALVMRLVRLGYGCPPKGSLADRADVEQLSLAEFVYDGELLRLEQDDPDWFRHLVAAGAHTGRPPAEIADRLRALGFLIPEAALAPRTSDEDVRLLGPVLVTGHEPWVRPAEPVPVSHVLQAARARGTAVSSVLTRLGELGCTLLPDLPDREVTEDDLGLLSEGGDGRAPWVGDTVPYGRLLHAAAATGHGIREVADRYRELGCTEVDLPAGPLPASVSEQDADLVAVRTGSGPRHWPAVDEEIPLWHILLRADAGEVAPAEIGRRFAALGFRRLPAPLPDTVFPGDPVLISRNHDSEAPWLAPDATVPSEHVHTAAQRLGRRSPYDVGVRLVALGHTLEYTPRPEDAVIPDPDDWSMWRRNLGEVLLSARALGRTPVEIAARLAELGYGWWMPPEPDGFDDEDLLVLSSGLDSRGPWINWDETPQLRHVLRAAEATGHSPQDIGERLTRLGHVVQVPPEADVKDLQLADLFPRDMESVSIEQLLEFVRKTGRSPAELAGRLSTLGYTVPDMTYPTRRPVPTPPRRG